MIKSMTSFAHCSDQGNWGLATWEVRSLNHRYLDCSFRLPESLRKLELDLRELVRKQISRGRIECSLQYQPGDAAAPELSLNTNLIKQLAIAAKQVGEQFKNSLSPVNPMHVLSWNNVLQISETDSELVHKRITKLFEQTLTELVAIREQEGTALKKLIEQKLPSVLSEVTKVKKILPAIIKQQRAKLLSRLAEIKTELDASRLEQEMVFFVQKIDVTEELERIETHVQEVYRVLKKGGVIGKRLDFLMQELNREANTLASKSIDKKTTHAAVEIKVLIEQMREQVQNIE